MGGGLPWGGRECGWFLAFGGNPEKVHHIAQGNLLEHLHGFHQAHFEVEFFVGGPADFFLHHGEVVDQFEQAFLAGEAEGGFEHLAAFRGHIREDVLGIDGENQQVAEERDHIAEQVLQVAATVVLRVHHGQCAGAVLGEHEFGEIADDLGGGEAEYLDSVFFLDGIATESDELVEHALGVAHAAVGTAGNGLGGCRAERDVFLAGNVEEVTGDDGRGNRAQVEALAAAEDGGQDLVRLGGGEDELHVGRWFLEGLEQGIECRGREHVDLVDVVNLVAGEGRRVLGFFAQFPDLIHAIVGGTVDFLDVDRPAFGDFDAERVVGIKIGLRAAGAIQCLGEDPGGRCLAGTTRSDKEIGLGDTVVLNGIPQRTDHMVLAEDVVECPGSVFSGKNLIAAHAAQSSGTSPDGKKEFPEFGAGKPVEFG